MPKRELFYTDRASLKHIVDTIVYATGDDDLFVHLRQGASYQALYVVFSRSRHSGQMERDLTQKYNDEFGPITFVTSADLGNSAMIVFYFDSARLTQPVNVERAREIAAQEGEHLVRPRLVGDGPPLRRRGRPEAVQSLRPHRVAQRRLSRNDSARAGAPGHRLPRAAGRGSGRARPSPVHR